MDLHALRNAFVTRLLVAKVHPRVAMPLAGHSRIELTLGTYTDLHLLDLQGAMDSLPAVPPAAEAHGETRGTKGTRETA